MDRGSLPEESKPKNKDSHIRVLNGRQVSMSRWALEITLVDITGVHGLEDCEDKISGCDLITLDMSGFSVSLRPEVSFAFYLTANEPTRNSHYKYRSKVNQTLDLPGMHMATDASMRFV
jgi:hypothetical protein